MPGTKNARVGHGLASNDVDAKEPSIRISRPCAEAVGAEPSGPSEASGGCGTISPRKGCRCRPRCWNPYRRHLHCSRPPFFLWYRARISDRGSSLFGTRSGRLAELRAVWMSKTCMFGREEVLGSRLRVLLGTRDCDGSLTLRSGARCLAWAYFFVEKERGGGGGCL